jgi:hypothetical protein
MRCTKQSGAFSPMATLLAGAAATALIVGMAIASGTGPASAKEEFAARTGKPCTYCHTAPPKLNDVGRRFKAKGFRL